MVAGFGGTALPRPAAEAPDSEPGGLEVADYGVPGDSWVRLDSPERAAKEVEGEDLMLFGGVRSLAHGGERPP